jgi:hypothetical protein
MINGISQLFTGFGPGVFSSMLLVSRCPLNLRGIAFAGLLTTLAVAPVLARAPRQDKKADQKQADAAGQAQAQEVQNLVRLADSAMTGQQVPSDLPIQFQNDFLKAQAGRVWVPMTLTIEPDKLTTAAVTLYVRVTPRGMTAPPAAPATDPTKKNDKDKKKDNKQAAPAASPYPFEDVSFLDLKPPAAGQPVRIARGFGVPAGNYDLYVVLRERAAAGATPKTAVLKQPLEAPNYAGSGLTTSSVLLAERIDTLPTAVTPEQQSEHPYAFGQQEIVVSADHKFKKTQELIVLFQIYNPTISPEKKFSLEATYTFYRTGPDGEKKFNSTEPQQFSPEGMGAGFDPTAAEQSIQAGQGIPLQSFPEGPYRLEIKVTDKLANPAKALTLNVNFTVTS